MLLALHCSLLLLGTLLHKQPVQALRDLRQSQNTTSNEEEISTSIAVPVASRIYGGSDAERGRYPYMCSLRTNGHLHRCGGVLIKPTWILTAAHCVDPMFASTLGINPVTYIGGWDIDDDENSDEGVEVVRPIQTIMHPGWTGEVENGSDLALLQLGSPSAHQPIAINSLENELHTGQKLVAIGWGELDDGSPSRILQQAADLEFVSLKNCQKVPYAQEVGDGIVCAYADTQDTCKGDSGGPLILANHRMGDVSEGSPTLDLLIGITSFGPAPCTQTDLPSISTDAAFFRDWIMNTIDEGKSIPPLKPSKPPKLPDEETTSGLGEEEDTNTVKQVVQVDVDEEDTTTDRQVEPADVDEEDTVSETQVVGGVEPQILEDRSDIKFVVLKSEDPVGPPAQETPSKPPVLHSVPVPPPSYAPQQPVQQVSPVSDTTPGTGTTSTSITSISPPSNQGVIQYVVPRSSTPPGTSNFGLSRSTWYSSSGGITVQGSSSFSSESSSVNSSPPRPWSSRIPPPRSWILTSTQLGSSSISRTSSRISTPASSSTPGG